MTILVLMFAVTSVTGGHITNYSPSDRTAGWDLTSERTPSTDDSIENMDLKLREDATCTDTDAGHLDKDGDGCNNYTDIYYCGRYDDGDFQAKAMCCLCGGGNNHKDLTDFSSKAAMEMEGWTFDWNDQYVFSTGAHYCRDVLSTSYCGFKFPGDGTLSYTFSYSGTATLEYGQSWDTGSVHVKKNDEEIESMSNRGSSTVIFDFSSGDVLKITEVDSVINIDKLTFQKSG